MAVKVPARLNVVTLGVRDLPGVRSFYEALGWESRSADDQFARFEIGGAVLALYSLDALAEDVALATLFLASESSAWLTGVTLDVAGGKIML